MAAPSLALRSGAYCSRISPCGSIQKSPRIQVLCAISSGAEAQPPSPASSRRVALASAAALAATVFFVQTPALGVPAQSLPPANDADLKLCSEECEADLEQIPLQSLPSGLQFRDILVGKGPSPPVGFQVAADCVAMLPSGKVFDSSLEKKVPYIFRVGAGQVVAGLDEGILSMNVGGLRRLYIPGSLSFPKGLPSAPGRPRVPPASPIIFDVKLLYIPGLEVDDE